MGLCSDLRKQRLPFGLGHAQRNTAGAFAPDIGVDAPPAGSVFSLYMIAWGVSVCESCELSVVNTYFLL